jgi:lincosamide nucleotidyltransferase A/C/D/E
MRADQVVTLYLDLEGHGVRVWLMGGWGIDALLGEQTRDHHDLDVLVEEAALERCVESLHRLGFELRFLWDDETWWIHHPSWSSAGPLPTAFVYGHRDGREIDVHVVRLDGTETATTLWSSPYSVIGQGLGGCGVVAGHSVRCLTAEMQRVAHTGYELPPHQLADLRRLAEASPS